MLDGSHRFVFLIGDVPVRLYRDSADEATCRTLRRHAIEVQQLTLTLGEERTESLVFRAALEASAAAGVQCVVFLTLRGEAGRSSAPGQFLLSSRQLVSATGGRLTTILGIVAGVGAKRPARLTDRRRKQWRGHPPGFADTVRSARRRAWLPRNLKPAALLEVENAIRSGNPA